MKKKRKRKKMKVIIMTWEKTSLLKEVEKARKVLKNNINNCISSMKAMIQIFDLFKYIIFVNIIFNILI